MPSTAAYPPQQGPAASPAAAQPQVVPFAQAAKHGIEQAYVSANITLGAAQQQVGPIPLPATGYLRRVLVRQLTATAGVAGTGGGDYPHNIFALIRLTDTNGAPLFELSGYNTLLADTYGGYAGAPDPRVDPDYSATTTAPDTELYVPIEIDQTGLGALANLSASSAYRITAVVDASTNIYSVAPTTQPIVQVQIWCEYWTLPNPVDMDGRHQQVAPPYAGTVQLWTQVPNVGVSAGSNRLGLNRMGNLLRTVIGVFRLGSGVRSDTITGDPMILKWDDINLLTIDRRSVRKIMREYVNDLSARDAGVYLLGEYSRGLTRFVGGNGAASWLPTVTATRYELLTPAGGGAAGTIDWVVNDVSVAPTEPEARASQGGGVGFHPPVGQVIAGAQ